MNLRVIFHKQHLGEDLWGMLGLVELDGGYYLTSLDQREAEPTVHYHQDLADSLRIFNETIAICKDRGWSVVYFGRPHYSG